MSNAEEAVRTLLSTLGDDVNREGLRDTPRRVVSMLMELTAGLRGEAPPLTVFTEGVENDQIVLIQDIPFWSLCEHHLAPFFGVAHIAYLCGKTKVGLSKPARVLDYYATRPQVQERLTTQIANHLADDEEFKPRGVMVVIVAQHLCMGMRGVKKHGSLTTTSALRGGIDKTEVLALLQVGRR